MANNKNITTTDLDFDAIKSNLKTFMKGQDAFKDYDFEGSAMSVLMDVLAYNTHYNALYTNLAVNESFLDSASKRSSVVSRAKEIGYIPYSASGAVATVDIVVSGTTSTPVELTIPAYTPFSATIDTENYTFYNTEDLTAVIADNQYTFVGVKLKEGNPLTFAYSVAEGVQYIIPNVDVDLSTLKVRVQDNPSSSNFTTFVRQENIINLTGTSNVYFVKEIEGQLYELQFGDGNIGTALANGNVVNLTYMTTNKTVGNGARLFSYSGGSLLGGSVSITTTTPANGGSDVESIDSIRYNAPKAYTAQNRAVTADDYKAIIYSLYPEAQSINIWGGENNIPKMYGKVFVSIKPKTSTKLTDVQKTFIKNEILKSKNVVSITPEIVDPEFINLKIDTTVYYNPLLTTKTANEIKDLAVQAIKDFNNNNLSSFSGVFKFSKFSAAIDAIEPSVTSNITTIKLHREVSPAYNINATYNVELGNPIYGSGVPEQSILTTGFYILGRTEVMYMEDLPIDTTYGLLRMFYFDEVGTKVYYRTIGTVANPAVNYKTGSITAADITVVGLDLSNTLQGEWLIKPQSNDVVSVRNQLITIPDNNITVNVVVDSVSINNITTDSSGGSNYVFTSSRN